MEDKHDQRETLEALNRQLAEQEQSLNAAYASLGEKYYAKCQNNPEEWARNEVAAIGEAEKRLSGIKEKVCELRGIRLCPNCGQEVPADGVFCSNCGTVLLTKKNSEASDGSLTCRQCGSIVRQGQKFCIRCGTRVDQAQDNKAPQMRAQVTMVPDSDGMHSATNEGKASTPPQPAPLKNMCPNCKKVFPDEMKFCTSCGTRLIRG